MDYYKLNQLIYCIMDGYHVPRKVKKSIIGVRLNKSRRLFEFKRGNFCFCPKCGCQGFKHIYHDVEYPEVFMETKCVCCGYHVGGADNSRYEFFHENLDIVEFKELMYKITK